MDYLYSLQVIRENCPSFINYFFILVSEGMVRGGIIIAAFLYWCYDKNRGRRIIVTYSTAYFINQIVKNIACVPRPWYRDSRLHVEPLALEHATGYSFPSGHTVSAASSFGAIGITYRKNKLVLFLMNALVLLVAFSRNWLGCHTIQDVLIAILIGSIVICIVNFIDYKLADNRDSRSSRLLLLSGILFTLSATIFMILKNYPPYVDLNGNEVETVYSVLTDSFTCCGVQLGVLLGILLEERFLKFEVVETTKNRILVAFIGAACVGALYVGLSLVLRCTGEHISHLVKYFIIFLFITFIYPLIFSKILKK